MISIIVEIMKTGQATHTPTKARERKAKMTPRIIPTINAIIPNNITNGIQIR